MLQIDQYVNLLSSLIGAIIGGIFTFLGVIIGLRYERKRNIILQYQQHITEMIHFNDTIETLGESVTTITFEDEFYQYELDKIDKVYSRCMEYVNVTAKIDLKLCLLVSALAEEIYQSRSVLKHNDVTLFKTNSIPAINALVKKIIKRNNTIKRY